MSRSLSPREAAEQLGISPDTLRRWERNGLIQSERTPGGQRRYDEEAISSILERPAEEQSHLPRNTVAPSLGRNEPREQAHPPALNRQVAPWERRIQEEHADLEVTRIRSERAALIRAECLERERRERAASEERRASIDREAEQERIVKAKASQQTRLSELRAYGKACALWAPAEYQAKVVRDLLISVALKDYPPDLPDHLARVQVNARVEEILKPWKDEEARKRAKLESQRKLDSLMLTGKWHSQTETRSWDRRAAEQANREVVRTLHEEVDASWADDDVRDLVDEVLDEWEED